MGNILLTPDRKVSCQVFLICAPRQQLEWNCKEGAHNPLSISFEFYANLNKSFILQFLKLTTKLESEFNLSSDRNHCRYNTAEYYKIFIYSNLLYFDAISEIFKFFLFIGLRDVNICPLLNNFPVSTYNMTYIDSPTRTDYEEAENLRKRESEEIITIPEQELNTWEKIDAKFTVLVIQSKNRLVSNQPIGCSERKSDEYYCKNTIFPNLSELKTGATSISDQCYINFCEHLKELYDQNVLFAKFPLKAIDIVGPSELKLNLLEAQRYLSVDPLPAVEYKKRIEKWKMLFSLKIFRMKKNPQNYPSKLGKIPGKLLRFPIIDDPNLLIGKGGYGSVYSNEYNGTKVGIKISNENREEVKLAYEYYLAKKISHPNIIQTIGYTVYQKRFGIIMEYCPLGSLSKYLKNPELGQSLDLLEKVKILIGIATGLRELHMHNIAHFDLKPHNIFLSENLTPKIADFGLSQIIEDGKKTSASGCTIFYSPPEQVKNEKPGQAADIWGFGMIMYNLLTGLHPFYTIREDFQGNASNEKQRYYECIHNDMMRPIIPQDFEENLPQITHLMRKCWIEVPQNRPQISEILQELQDFSKVLKKNPSQKISQ